MRKFLQFGWMGVLTLLIALSGCAPPTVPNTVSPTSGEQTQLPTVSDTPALTTAPTGDPTLQPVNSSGPEMAVDSTFTYVDDSTLVAVPAGPFTMGRAGGTDNPEHMVTLDGFWIYRTEVTNRQYALCVASGKCSTPDTNDDLTYDDPLHANDPVVGVSWDQAQDYCGFVHGRLPTEAEWEKTARGPDGNLYPWGDGAPSCDLLNYNNCTGQSGSVIDYPQGASYYGALDMEGNVTEWVADWYDATYYRHSPEANPPGADQGQRRSVRSSSYKSGDDEVPAAVRRFEFPDHHNRELGFRCVVEDPTYFALMCEQAAILGTPPQGNPNYPPVSEACPTVAVTFGQYCDSGNTPKTNVQVIVSPNIGSVNINVPPSCTGGPPIYNCLQPGGDVSVQADCYNVVPESVKCPQGTTKVGGLCIAQGSPGECLPGYNYDPDKQCCTADPNSQVIAFPLCPVGMYYANPPDGCLPYPAQGVVNYGPQSIPFKSCEPPPPGNPTPCVNPVGAAGCP